MKRPGRPKRRRDSSPVTEVIVAEQETSITTSSPSRLPSSQSQARTDITVYADDSVSDIAVPQRKRQDRRKRESRSAVEVVDDDADARAGTGAGENGRERETVTSSALDSSQQASSSKRVRFNNREEEEGSAGEIGPTVVTPTEVTPNMKRATLDQSFAAEPAQTITNNARANSISAVMSSSPSGPFQQVQFSPLRDVLNGRLRRRLRRSHLSEVQNEVEEHKREDVRRDHELDRLRRSSEEKDRQLKQLMLELELQKQMGIDIAEESKEEKGEHAKHVQRKQDEIVQIKNEIAELRSKVDAAAHGPSNDTNASSVMNVDFDDDDDNAADNSGLILVEPSDIDIPRETMSVRRESTPLVKTPKTPYTRDSITNDTSISMIDIPDPAHEAERKEFEKALTALSRKLSDAQAALQIFSIELQTLGFASENASPESILSAIRNSFQQVRLEIHELLPGQVSLDVSNGDFLHVLVGEVRRLIEQVRDISVQNERYDELERVLRAQIDGVLDKLAKVDARNRTLELQWSELDKESERKEKEIIELGSQVEDLEEESQEQTLELNDRDEKIKELEEVLGESSTTIEQLQNVIQSYRDEIATLEAQAVKMDSTYKAQISEMWNDYTKKLAETKDALDSETLRREMAETDVTEKTTEITELKVKLEDAATKVDRLRAELQSTQSSIDSEKSRADAAEVDLADKNDVIETLEEKIKTAETALSELHEDLRTLENMVTAERRQREEAEALVDERGDELESLRQKLDEAGTLANELRQKLFEVQQQREKEIAESAERQNELSLALGSEQERAVTAEQSLEVSRMEMKAYHDKAVMESNTLNEEINEKSEALLSITNEVKTLKESIETMSSEFEKEKSEQEKQSTIRLEYIQRLQNEIDEQKEKITELVEVAADETLAHEMALEKRDVVEKDLQEEIAAQQQKIEDLEAAKHGLEIRIESEAEELLNTQAKHADESDSLRKTLAEREHVLDVTVTERTELQSLFEQSKADKDVEVSALREELQSREDKIDSLSEQNSSLRRMLATRVTKEQHLLQRIVEDAQLFTGEVQKSSAVFMADGSRVLKEIEEVDDEAEADALINDVQDKTERTRLRALETPVSMGASVSVDDGSNYEGNNNQQQMQVQAAAAPPAITTTKRKTVVSSRRRTRKREYDSGIGFAVDEQDQQQEQQRKQQSEEEQVRVETEKVVQVA